MKTLLDKSWAACYERGSEPDEDGVSHSKVYSTFQRNEMAERWEEDGKITIVIRRINKQEARERDAEIEASRQAAIKRGDLVIDRVGRPIWKKH